MKKVKAVPTSAKSKAALEEQLKPVQPKVKRRVRTSVAIMAIAISMGGPNLLLTRQSDRAPAAEMPPGKEPAASKVSATTTPPPTQTTNSVIVEAVPAPVSTSAANMPLVPASELSVTGTVSLPVSPPAAESMVQVDTATRTPSRVERRQKQNLAMDAGTRKSPEPKAAPSRVATTRLNSHSTEISTAKARAAQRQDRLVQKLKSVNKVEAIAKPSAVHSDSFTQSASNTNNLEESKAPAAATTDRSIIGAKQKLLVNRLKQQSNHSQDSSAELRSEEFNNSSTKNQESSSLSTVMTAQPSNASKPAKSQATVERSQAVGASNQSFIVNPQIPQIPSASIFNRPQSSAHSLDSLKVAPPAVIGKTEVTRSKDTRNNSIVVDIKESLVTPPVAVIPQGSPQQGFSITEKTNITPFNADAVNGQIPGETVQIDRSQSFVGASPLPETAPVEFGITNDLQQDTVAQEVIETARPQNLAQQLQPQMEETSQSVVVDTENLKTPEPETVYVISQATEDASKVSVQVASLATEYQVKPGDTLTAIAREYGVSLYELVSANQIPNPDQLKINQSITIPTAVYNGTVDQTSQQTATASSKPHVSAVPAVSARITNNSEAQAAAFVSYSNLPTNSAVQPTTGLQLSETQVVSNSTGMGGSISNEEPLDPPSFYVQGLQAEITQLRQKYNNQATNSPEQPIEDQTKAVEIANVAAPPPVKTKSATIVTNPPRSRKVATEPINPEFRVAQANTSDSSTIKARLATAPTNVDPTEALQSLRGRQVSPELPPLGAADMYLPKPGTSAPFKGYIWPAKGVLSSGYGWRWGRMHRGIDVAAPVGTPIFAAASGVIVRAGWNSGGYGNLVDIKHPDGSLTRYAHNNRILVRAGQEVEQGQHIAEMGSTGFSTGPHLHFEVHAAGKGAINPIALLPRR